MAKALYGFLTYPESIKTEEMQNFLESRKFDFAYCLHDADKHKDGTPKKEHVHWLVGFEKKALSVKEMLLLFESRFYVDVTEKQLISEEMRNLTESVSGFRPPAEYEMPTGEKIPLIKHIEIMRSSQASEDYLEHKNNPEKADYSGKAYYSQYWDISGYFTYEEKRKMKSAEKKSEYGKLYQLISESPDTICSFSALLAYIVEKSPDLLTLAIDKAYAVEKLLKSHRDDRVIYEQADQISRLKIEVQTKEDIIKEKSESIGALNAEIKQLREDLEYLKPEIQKLEYYQQEITNLRNIVSELTEQNGNLAFEYLEQTGENPYIE